VAEGAPLTAAAAFAAGAGRDADRTLDDDIAAAVAEAAHVAPGATVDRIGFAGHMGQLAADGAAPPRGPALVDLYLAFAAARGDPAAIAWLEREVLPAAIAALRALGTSPGDVDEAAQRVREKLLFGGDGGPRLLGYRGQGRLRAWARVVAVREELMAGRARRREVPLGDAVLAAAPDPSDDPELGHLRRHYRAELATAMAAAVGALTVRERALLRYSFVDGLLLDEIGAIYRAHKSSVSRWLARARARLWQEARAALQERLAIDAGELDSIVRLLRSGLDLSLERLLQPPGGDPRDVE